MHTRLALPTFRSSQNRFEVGLPASLSKRRYLVEEPLPLAAKHQAAIDYDVDFLRSEVDGRANLVDAGSK